MQIDFAVSTFLFLWTTLYYDAVKAQETNGTDREIKPRLEIEKFKKKCPHESRDRVVTYVTADLTGIAGDWKYEVNFMTTRGNETSQIGKAQLSPCPSPVSADFYCRSKDSFVYTVVFNKTVEIRYSGSHFFAEMHSVTGVTAESPKVMMPLVKETIRAVMTLIPGGREQNVDHVKVLELNKRQKNHAIRFVVTGLIEPFSLGSKQYPGIIKETINNTNEHTVVVLEGTTRINLWYKMPNSCEKLYPIAIRELIVDDSLAPKYIALIGATTLAVVISCLCWLKNLILRDAQVSSPVRDSQVSSVARP